MSTLKKIFIGCIVIVVLTAVAASIYVKVYGRSLLEQAISRSLEKEVRLDSVAYQFPFGVRAGNVRIEPDFLAGEVLAQFAPASVWAEPRRVTRLLVNGGTYNYAGGGENPLRFRVEDIRLEAGDILIPPASVHTSFKFWGRLVMPFISPVGGDALENNPLNGSRVESSGWVDWVNKDLEGTLEVVEPGGRAGLTAKAVSKNNDMTVTGDLKMSSLPPGLTQKAGDKASAVSDVIFGALSSMGVEVGAQFSFKTRMDDLQISNVAFSGKVVADDFSGMFGAGSSGVPPASE